MSEPQDALAEELRPLLAWAEAVSQHHAMLRTEPPFTTTQALKEALASAYAALVRTPETLDAEHAGWRNMTPAQWDAAAAYEASLRDNTTSERRAELLAATRAATPSPAPPEGLRAAVALIAADWFDTGYENGRLDHGVLADRLFAALAASPAPDPGADQ